MPTPPLPDTKTFVPPAVNELMAKAVNRLHHVSMRVAAAFWELPKGEPCGMLPVKHPGLHHVRSCIDLMHFTRAEISALTKLLIDKGVFTAEEYSRQAIDEYNHITFAKAREFGIEVTNEGIVFHNPYTQQ